LKKILNQLIETAKKARLNSYSPYSKISVGAALLTEEGKIFTGTNIENVSIGLTICAERVAIYSAVNAGYRKFKMIAIVGDTDGPCTPCGLCRQVMTEFSPEMIVVMGNLKNEIMIKKAKELIPYAFKVDQINKEKNR